MPKYVLINKSNRTLCVCQENSIINEVILGPGKRNPFFWADCRNEYFYKSAIIFKEIHTREVFWRTENGLVWGSLHLRNTDR
jgi:hypothetical protein